MKMRKNILGLVAVILFCLSACKKDNGPEQTQPVAPVLPLAIDSNYISKIYSLDTSSVGAKKKNVTIFNYDNSKRVVQTIDTATDSQSLNTNVFSITNLFYIGTDTLPYKITSIRNTNFGSVPVTRFLFYDNTGRITKDSSFNTVTAGSIFATFLNVDTYTYSGNNMYTFYKRTDLNIPVSTTFYKDTALLDVNKNITLLKNYIYDPSSSSYSLRTINNYTFDAKRNPFASIKYLQGGSSSTYLSSTYLYVPVFASANNSNTYIRSYYTGGTLTGTLQTNYINTYNQNGLVKDTKYNDLLNYNRGRITYDYISL
jgi:hypothetical protein